MNILDEYFELSFLRNLDLKGIHEYLQNDLNLKDKFHNEFGTVYFSFLDWDTKFFNLVTVKIHFVDYHETGHFSKLINSFEQFCREKYQVQYIFLEIPSEDIGLIQNLNRERYSLIETRLHYFKDNIESFQYNDRYNTRLAENSDIEKLRNVASKMRNDFDRFHADKVFNQNIADSFLSKYVENAIRGYSDIVLVPNEQDLPSNSFLTADYQKKYLESFNVKVAKMVLSAVDSETNKGWYIKLISEMTYYLKANGVSVIHMNTQSTNRAVIKVWTKLGYQFGRCTHVLSKSFL